MLGNQRQLYMETVQTKKKTIMEKCSEEIPRRITKYFACQKKSSCGTQKNPPWFYCTERMLELLSKGPSTLLQSAEIGVICNTFFLNDIALPLIAQFKQIKNLT